MQGKLVSRLLVSALLALGVSLFSVFLANIPSLYLNEGFPLFPALLSAEAMFFGISLCAYGIYAVLVKPSLDERRASRARDPRAAEPWMQNAQWSRKRIVHSAGGVSLFLWLFVINWWGAIGFFAQDRGEQLVNESVPILMLCIVFVLVGLVSLWTALRKTLDWLRHDCFDIACG